MSNELSPCPVCGGVAVLEKHYPRMHPTAFSVRCKYCCFGTVSHEDRGLVVETWNHLTPIEHAVGSKDNSSLRANDLHQYWVESQRGLKVWKEDNFVRKGKGQLTYCQLKKDNKAMHTELNKLRNELYSMTVAHNKLLSRKPVME